MQQHDNKTQLPKVAIVYLSYHCEPYIDDVVSALRRLSYPRDRVVFIVVDNPHPTYGSSMRHLTENVLPLSGQEIPEVVLLPQAENTGFAGGNNIGATWALEHGYDYVYFHNNDGFMATNCLEPIVDFMETHPKAGIAQSLILLHPDTELINTSGNAFHYLGFGFCNNYRIPLSSVTLPETQEIGYASGAGMMVRASLIRAHGGWDNDFFLYHEDMEWTFRLRVLGYTTHLVRDSVFFHKYQFGRSIEKFFWMERNRYGVMLMFFRWPTLLLMLPVGLALELGLWLFAFRNGTASERVKVYRYWFDTDHLRLWLGKRKNIQSMRTVSDRFLLSFGTGVIHFQEKSMRNPLLLYVGNPVMNIYFHFLKLIVWW